LEGKKAEQISPRKSTPRTLKGIDQQYPPVIGAGDHLSNNAIGQCTETRYIRSAQITPPAYKVLDDCQYIGPTVVRSAVIYRPRCSYGKMSSAMRPTKGDSDEDDVRPAGGGAAAGGIAGPSRKDLTSAIGRLV
jgi:hypothetical protein